MRENLSSSYLVSISLGPVQDFIASARRTRDLWFGSWLLSELSKSAARAIGKDNLIFPSISCDSQLSPDSPFNVVNKILAIVDDPNEIGNRCTQAIEDRLQGIYVPLFDEVTAKLRGRHGVFFRDKAIEQIRDMTEVYWVAYPYDPGQYPECRNRVEMLLNARKSTRDFIPASWASSAPKSSLDGLRESVILDKEIDDVTVQRIFRLRKKERLCGIGVLKRLAEEDRSAGFASTSHMAALPLLSTLVENDTNNEALDDYISELTNQIFEIERSSDLGRVPSYLHHDVFGDYDGHLLYKNRLSDLPFQTKENEEKASQALDVFLKTAFAEKHPSPYFVLLLADGDNMGAVINNQSTPDEHRRLSQALSKFVQDDEADDVQSIVQRHSGSLIYAGGDDVLALLPLHTALDCAKTLALTFENKLGDFEFTDDKQKEIRPTLSVGLAIAHHTEPLQDSLTTIRRAEKEAKSVDGKNALAIILSKRSGVDTAIKGSWENDRDTGCSFDERLKWFIYLHLAEALPSGVAYELRDLWIRFRDTSNSRDELIPGYEALVKAEAYRIIKRKKVEGGARAVTDGIVTRLRGLINKPDLSIHDIAREIIVAKEFSRSYKQANISAARFASENGLSEGGDE